ncbi:MarR family transcriptional regulator [uncultured Piscinibacter sp.]|uniref:MarR family winged helix-turn-helix transcriptional regulator n=1 Tax=uncultured Piscinibacter sp. TaxID=1131835 RepID=UPI00262DBA94|nr:MarR family transcriptional regulator [uncultured Piscinibacter sp.]
MAAPRSAKRPPSPHGTQAWLAVVRAYNLCDAVMTARLAALGVRITEHEVLANLASAPGITQQTLAARCFVAKSGVSMLLTQMESRGWVRREADSADARVRRLHLTPAGLALAGQTLQVQSEVVAAMVAGATDAELEQVTASMQRVSQRLEALREADELSPASTPRSRARPPARRG